MTSESEFHRALADARRHRLAEELQAARDGAVQRGMISSVLEEPGSAPQVDALDVFVEPDRCVARLAPRSA